MISVSHQHYFTTIFSCSPNPIIYEHLKYLIICKPSFYTYTFCLSTDSSLHQVLDGTNCDSPFWTRSETRQVHGSGEVLEQGPDENASCLAFLSDFFVMMRWDMVLWDNGDSWFLVFGGFLGHCFFLVFAGFGILGIIWIEISWDELRFFFWKLISAIYCVICVFFGKKNKIGSFRDSCFGDKNKIVLN